MARRAARARRGPLPSAPRRPATGAIPGAASRGAMVRGPDAGGANPVARLFDYILHERRRGPLPPRARACSTWAKRSRRAGAERPSPDPRPRIVSVRPRSAGRSARGSRLLARGRPPFLVAFPGSAAARVSGAGSRDLRGPRDVARWRDVRPGRAPARARRAASGRPRIPRPSASSPSRRSSCGRWPLVRALGRRHRAGGSAAVGLRIPGPIVLYQPRDRDRTLPLGLLHLGSALAGQPVVVVDGRLDLAPEARVVGAGARGPLPRGDRPHGSAHRRRSARDAGRAGGEPDAARRLGRAPIPPSGPRSASPRRPRTSPRWAGERGRSCEMVARPARARARAGPRRARAGAATGRWSEEPPRAREELARIPAGGLRARRPRGLLPVAGRAPPGLLLEPRPAGLGAEPWTGLPVERRGSGAGRPRPPAPGDRGGVPRTRTSSASRAGRRRSAAGCSERGVHVAWSGAGQAADARAASPPSFFRALAGSGCRRVRVTAPGDVRARRGRRSAALMETAERLHRAGIGGRFAFTAGHPGQGPGGLQTIHRTARALRRIDPRFETPIRLYAPYPGAGTSPPGFTRAASGSTTGRRPDSTTGSFVPPAAGRGACAGTTSS